MMARRTMVFVLALGLSLTGSSAFADSRLFDGALGAGAGALVGGPVGAVAGGVVGYTAGPSISCGMRGGCRHYHHYHRHPHYHYY
jgi:hypothetical protein